MAYCIDSIWRKHVLVTDDTDTQWRKLMRILSIDVTYALSPIPRLNSHNQLPWHAWRPGDDLAPQTAANLCHVVSPVTGLRADQVFNQQLAREWELERG
ncbi:MAG: hypothetical protein JJE12_07045 [Anaerolineales bacterium]|nr:hypothetical protein [Anaerolineales bacterium]